MIFVFQNTVTVLEHSKGHGSKYQRMGLIKSDSVLYAFKEFIFILLFWLAYNRVG